MIADRMWWVWVVCHWVFFVRCFASNADVVQADDVYKLQSSLMLMYD
jgi:hypothetical protein